MITEQITIDSIIHATGLPADVDICGQRWLDTGSPFRQCEVCNGTGGIASASRCPECEPCSTPPRNS